MQSKTNLKRILLTGDDGYNSLGTRLLIRALKDTYDLQIAATKHQQSGAGGRLSLATGCSWGEDEVDGIPALWVDGSPADTMECAQSYFSQPFDLIISGVNLGANVSTSVISSGTYGAAVRGLGAQVAPRAVAISWDAPSFWNKQHSKDDTISEYFEYPGDILAPLIARCVADDFWGVSLLNINLPAKPSRKVRFTKILKDITQYYAYPIEIDYKNHTFNYDRVDYNIKGTNPRYDVVALSQGYISITPCAIEMTHFQTFERLENTTLSL